MKKVKGVYEGSKVNQKKKKVFSGFKLNDVEWLVVKF